MDFISLTLPTLPANLALDEALLLEAEAGMGTEMLRVWEWASSAVVLGSGCRIAEDVDRAACVADGVPMGRRASGGGTVLLGPGCLCYTLVLDYARAAELRDIRSSYCYIFARMQGMLKDRVPGLHCAGTSDLAIDGRKVSGNAQQRKRNFLLHHGTLLYDFDCRAVERYLRLPLRQPEYREGRNHVSFLTNLPVAGAALTASLREVWQASTETTFWPRERVDGLVRDKYQTREWIERR